MVVFVFGVRIHILAVGSIPPITKNGRNLSGMNPIEQHHNKEHQEGVKDIQINIMAKYKPIEALEIFNSPKDRPHHDEHAANVKRGHVLLPRNAATRTTCWGLENRSVEGDCGNDEDAEAEELDEEADDDDFGTTV